MTGSKMILRSADTASSLAELDVLTTLSERARHAGTDCRPQFVEGSRCHIQQGRHPAGRAGAGMGPLWPMNLLLDPDTRMLIDHAARTWAGKSTYMRQTALILCCSRIFGSYVPAQAVELSLVDRIFTRSAPATEPGRRPLDLYGRDELKLANILAQPQPMPSLVLMG